jgi:RNA polymerase sigma-B factor
VSHGELEDPAEGLDEAELARFRNYRAHPTNESRNEIVVSYASLANALAQRFARRGEATEDLVQIAHYALIRAVERFDPDRGTPFVSFAVPTILGEIKRHFRDRTWGTHVVRSAKDLIPSINEATDALYSELHRAPTPAEVAVRVGRSVDHVLEAIDARRAYRPASLNATFDDGTPTVADQLGMQDRNFSVALNKMTVGTLLATLPERERTIVELRFFEDLSQSEIAARVGVSQMHVSRLLRKALTLLSEQLEGPEDGVA